MLKNYAKETRLNSEKRVSHPNFNLKVGTTNKNNPIAVYFDGRTFVCPTIEKDSYASEINEVRHQMRNSINRNLRNSDIFDSRFIFDFKISQNGMMYNKKSFLSFQVFLRQKSKPAIPLNDLKVSASSLLRTLVFDLEEKMTEYSFSLSKTKKDA